MSGMTMSMPSICSSGNMRPASIKRMSSPCSIAIMFFPISPTPPSGMIRTGLAKERHLLRRLRLRRLRGRGGGTRRGLEELRERLEVLLQVRSQRGLVERGGGVEDREDRDAVLLSGTSVDARDGFAGKELVHGVAAQGHDDLRPQRREVSLEPDVAGGHLLRQRVTVLRRTVAHDVRDEDLAAVQADARQQLIQQLAGRADERAALDVLVVARGLPEEQDPGFRAALAWDGLTRAAVERAGRAGSDLAGERDQGLFHVSDYRLARAFRPRIN